MDIDLIVLGHTTLLLFTHVVSVFCEVGSGEKKIKCFVIPSFLI